MRKKLNDVLELLADGEWRRGFFSTGHSSFGFLDSAKKQFVSVLHLIQVSLSDEMRNDSSNIPFSNTNRCNLVLIGCV